MNIFKVVYYPLISDSGMRVIRDNITPSMMSLDETTCQYQIDMCIQELLLSGEEDDAHILQEFANQEITYVEF